MVKQRKNTRGSKGQRKSLSLETLVKPDPGAKFYEKPFFFILIIIVITSISYFPSLKNDFINTWDDYYYVTNNPIIRELNSHSVKEMFTIPVNGSYVPLPMLTYAVEYKLFGYNPLPFHITNLVLHILCTLLVFQVFRLLKLNILYAALFALLSGIHPMRVESVAWITERKDLLYSLFYLASMILYIQFIKQKERRPVFFIFSLLLFIFSLLSKIQAVTLPLCLLLLDYYFERPIRLKLIIEKVPFFILTFICGIGGVIMLNRAGVLKFNEVISLGDRIFYGLYAFSAYIVKFFAPFHQSAFYPYPVSPGQSLPDLYYINPLFLLLIAFLIYRTIRYNRVVVTGTLFFLFNIMFLLQILSAGTAYLTDRFTYIPYTGLFFIAGWYTQQIAVRKKKRKILVLSVLSMIVVLFSILTFNRCKIWENGETLWTDVINKYPERNTMPYINRAIYYKSNKQLDKSLADYFIASKVNPGNAIVYDNIGYCYLEKDEWANAIENFQECLNIEEKNFDAILGMSLAYYNKNDIKSAGRYFKEAENIEPILKAGMTGISDLEKSGYSYSDKQEETLRKMFNELR